MCVCVCVCVRLVLSRFEVAGTVLGESAEEEEEDEEEVWLFWKDSKGEMKSKSIRELAQDAKDGHTEDHEVINYYRYAHTHTHTPTLTCNARKLMQKCNIKISLSGISWICLHGCVWIGNTWPLTRYQHNWMWIWSCAACQTKTCPLTSELHSAAWCCTCM